MFTAKRYDLFEHLSFHGCLQKASCPEEKPKHVLDSPRDSRYNPFGMLPGHQSHSCRRKIKKWIEHLDALWNHPVESTATRIPTHIRVDTKYKCQHSEQTGYYACNAQSYEPNGPERRWHRTGVRLITLSGVDGTTPHSVLINLEKLTHYR